jgi:hypothetical protein
MPRYLIEVPHEAEQTACMRAVKVFLDTGSHFLANADWGCLDGVHKAWITLEAEDKDQARLVLPPGFRSQAKIVRVNKFTLEDLDTLRHHHQGS